MSLDHIAKRAKERYGINLGSREVAAILAIVCDGGAKRVRDGVNGGDVEWELDFHGIALRVITVPDDRRIGRLLIATIMPSGCSAFRLGDVLGQKGDG